MLRPKRFFNCSSRPAQYANGGRHPAPLLTPARAACGGAAWGSSEDDPDYTGFYRIGAFVPPRRIVFTDAKYYAKTGPLPFKADFVTEFLIHPTAGGCVLQVTQDGFPVDPVADDFYKACETGWKNTFAGIHAYLEKRKK